MPHCGWMSFSKTGAIVFYQENHSSVPGFYNISENYKKHKYKLSLIGVIFIEESINKNYFIISNWNTNIVASTEIVLFLFHL